MKKVLILDGGAAHAMAIAECLKSSGYYVAIACDNKYEYGYHCNYVDEKYLHLDSHQEQYADKMLAFLKSNHFDVLIPTSDVAAEFISLHKSELQSISGVLMPDIEIFRKGYDKNELMKVCSEFGFPHPETADLREVGMDNPVLRTFKYPALLKPNITSGGRGMTLVHSFEELQSIYPSIKAQYGDCHLQRFVKQGGRQIKVQVMTNLEGNPAYSSVIWKQRYYPVNGGSSCCNVTIDNPEIRQICCSVLEKIGWVGFADFDLIEDPETHEFLIMEINPRIPACIRSVFKSGLDYATMIADSTLGKLLREYHYTPGKRLRHLGFDTLWFLKSTNRFKSEPSWFRFIGKDLFYQDWIKGNFRAFFWGSLGNLKKQMNPEFRKSKSGIKA